jgi:hypothetical protein
MKKFHVICCKGPLAIILCMISMLGLGDFVAGVLKRPFLVITLLEDLKMHSFHVILLLGAFLNNSLHDFVAWFR